MLRVDKFTFFAIPVNLSARIELCPSDHGKVQTNSLSTTINNERDVPILVRQVKYLNNIVEQDHRAIKRVTRPMLNFKSFRSAGAVLAGIELMHMIRKAQFAIDATDAMSFAEQFYALAGKVRPV
jgi:transposase-like protein